MGSSEVDKPAKEAKELKAPTTQEQSSTPTATANPDWTGFQAYSPMPPHGFLASSPQTHPYMWGVQGNTGSSMEADGKLSEGKEKLPIKRSKGSLGSLNMITGKNNEPGKTSGASANGAYSKSAESASEGSSEGSDANSQNDSGMKSGCGQESLEAEGSQNGGAMHGSHNGGPTTPPTLVNQTMSVLPMSAAGVPGPTTNLNIGMDYWSAAASSTHPALHGKAPPPPVAGGMVTTGSRESLQSQLWLQDERELKRQRRKQSNRESARRSRLRKQAECDELAQRAEALKEENATLRSELCHIRSEYEQLLEQNASLKERLGEIPGQEDARSGRNNQHVGNGTQQTGQKDLAEGGQ